MLGNRQWWEYELRDNSIDWAYCADPTCFLFESILSALLSWLKSMGCATFSVEKMQVQKNSFLQIRTQVTLKRGLFMTFIPTKDFRTQKDRDFTDFWLLPWPWNLPYHIRREQDFLGPTPACSWFPSGEDFQMQLVLNPLKLPGFVKSIPPSQEMVASRVMLISVISFSQINSCLLLWDQLGILPVGSQKTNSL